MHIIQLLSVQDMDNRKRKENFRKEKDNDLKNLVCGTITDKLYYVSQNEYGEIIIS